MHDLQTIIALNAKKHGDNGDSVKHVEPVNQEDLENIIELWEENRIRESWIEKRAYRMAVELRALRAHFKIG